MLRLTQTMIFLLSSGPHVSCTNIDFCGGLLKNVLKVMPRLGIVQIPGRSYVQMDGPLTSRLQREVEAQGKVLEWDQTGRGFQRTKRQRLLWQPTDLS